MQMQKGPQAHCLLSANELLQSSSPGSRYSPQTAKLGWADQIWIQIRPHLTQHWLDHGNTCKASEDFTVCCNCHRWVSCSLLTDLIFFMTPTGSMIRADVRFIILYEDEMWLLVSLMRSCLQILYGSNRLWNVKPEKGLWYHLFYFQRLKNVCG